MLTSATLDEGDEHDTVTLYALGERLVQFQLPSGAGARFLEECSLAKQP